MYVGCFFFPFFVVDKVFHNSFLLSRLLLFFVFLLYWWNFMHFFGPIVPRRNDNSRGFTLCVVCCVLKMRSDAYLAGE